jgi:hypothetical protein
MTLFYMTKLFKQAIERLRQLPEDMRNSAARALILQLACLRHPASIPDSRAQNLPLKDNVHVVGPLRARRTVPRDKFPVYYSIVSWQCSSQRPFVSPIFCSRPLHQVESCADQILRPFDFSLSLPCKSLPLFRARMPSGRDSDLLPLPRLLRHGPRLRLSFSSR